MHARFDVLSHPADYLLEYKIWDDYFAPLWRRVCFVPWQKPARAHQSFHRNAILQCPALAWASEPKLNLKYDTHHSRQAWRPRPPGLKLLAPKLQSSGRRGGLVHPMCPRPVSRFRDLCRRWLPSSPRSKSRALELTRSQVSVTPASRARGGCRFMRKARRLTFAARMVASTRN